MRTVIKPVHYCDHCKKKSLRRHTLLAHEATCLINPERKCRMCDDNNSPAEEFAAFLELVERVMERDWEYGCRSIIQVGNIYSITNCPACIMSLIKQTVKHYHGKCFQLEIIGFDYCKDRDDFLRKKFEDGSASYYY